MTASARVVGISRAQAYRRKGEDLAFSNRWETILDPKRHEEEVRSTLHKLGISGFPETTIRTKGEEVIERKVVRRIFPGVTLHMSKVLPEYRHLFTQDAPEGSPEEFAGKLRAFMAKARATMPGAAKVKGGKPAPVRKPTP